MANSIRHISANFMRSDHDSPGQPAKIQPANVPQPGNPQPVSRLNTGWFACFIARRLSRKDWLGLHLTLSVLASLLAILLFIALAAAISQQNRLTAFDSVLASRLHRHAQANPLAVAVFRPLTAFGSQPVLISIAVAVAIALSFRGRRGLSRVWLVIVSGGLLHHLLKPIVPRTRPQFDDPFLIEASLSFPSGHAMASLIGYGLLAYLLWRVLPHRWTRVGVVLLLGLLILAVGFSRLYLGVHYFSDVVGGYAAGTAWLVPSICAIETVRRYGQFRGGRAV